MEVIPHDTTSEAARIQRKIFRRMDPGKKLRMACSLSDSLRKLTDDGVRNRHPEYTDEQVKLAIIKLTLGRELFREVYSDADIEV